MRLLHAPRRALTTDATVSDRHGRRGAWLDSASERGMSDAEITISRPLARPPVVGDVIADKYRLARTLGRGGMGRIFAAEHLMLDTTVALKFMHPHLTRDPSAVARFAREARAAATLKSPHAARIIDVDQLSTGELYIVMEYLEGSSLETVATQGRGLPAADAVTYMLQACDALAEAHDRGIVHRDVKPANLFLTRGKLGEPMIKVLDFGLAKSVANDGFTSGKPEAVGTPQYMSPEQIAGSRQIDGRSDVWSIGVTLYELLAGRPAYNGSSVPAIFTHVLQGTPLPLSAHRPDVPPSVVAVVERCMAHDPAARFANVRELASALEATLTAPVAPALPVTALARPRASTAAPAVAQLPPGVPVLAPVGAPVGDPRRTWSSLSPSSMNVPDMADAPTREGGPSLRQTVLAALAGPAAIAVAAAVMAILLGTAGAGSAARAAASGSSASSDGSAGGRTRAATALTATAAVTTPRGKAVAVATVSPRCARNPRSPACAPIAQK